jgi:hypothetical protein
MKHVKKNISFASTELYGIILIQSEKKTEAITIHTSFPFITTSDTLSPEGNHQLLVLFIRNPHLLRILPNIRMNRLLNQLAPPTRNLQNQIIQRRATQNINMIRYPKN